MAKEPAEGVLELALIALAERLACDVEMLRIFGIDDVLRRYGEARHRAGYRAGIASVYEADTARFKVSGVWETSSEAKTPVVRRRRRT